MASAFCPGDSPTVKMAVGAASTRVVIATSAINARSMRIFNDSTLPAFIRFGDVTVVATVNDYPIGAAATEVITIAGNPTNVAVIGSSGNIYFTLGEGL